MPEQDRQSAVDDQDLGRRSGVRTGTESDAEPVEELSLDSLIDRWQRLRDQTESLHQKLAEQARTLDKSEKDLGRTEWERDRIRKQLTQLRMFRAMVVDLLGVERVENDDIEANVSQRRNALAAIKRLDAEATLVRELETGSELDLAVVRTVRRLLAASQHVRARSFSQALMESAATKSAGHLGMGLVAIHQKLRDFARHHFEQLDSGFRERHAAVEWLDLCYESDPEAASAHVESLPHTSEFHAIRLAATRFAYRERRRDLGVRHLEAIWQISGDDHGFSGQDRADFEWLSKWEWENQRAFTRTPDAATPSGAVAIGVMDYKQPDYLRQSSNLGDYVQTIGALTHIIGFRDVHFTGDPDLVGTLSDLRSRLRPEFTHQGSTGNAHLVTINRDASSYDDPPPDTWTTVFGWFMHNTFGGRYDFPLHENINPIIVSFHVQRREVLTPEAVAYLREHGPVGCRDWTTVYILLSLGVDAYFSGCLTTTVDAVFPERQGDRAESRIALVDVRVPGELAGRDDVDRITQASSDISRARIRQNVADAVTLLEEYQQYGQIVTSRLHCYLPATAIGCQVDFTPRRLSDVRFDGLLGAEPGNEVLRQIQNRLRAQLRSIYTEIFSGASKEQVYKRWREITAPDVQRAKQRLAAPWAWSAPSLDLESACADVLGHRVEMNHDSVLNWRGEHERRRVVNVALAADHNLAEQVPVVIESIADNTQRPLHIWFLARGHSSEQLEHLARTFPEVAFTVLPCDMIDYGEIRGMLKHTTVSTMDRLLLPDLLADVDRVIYHDIDAVTLADIGELYDTDLEGFPLAARSARASWAESGFGNIYRAAARLQHQTAFELRRGMHQNLTYDFLAFNAGIMVLDLGRLRRDEFCQRYFAFAERYGMNDQEILNCYVGPERKVLDPSWNAVVQQEVLQAPKIIHWAGPAKPWNREYVMYQERWDEYQRRYEARSQV